MIRVLSLLWTLAISLVITGVSFFYLRDATRGFPFSFSREVANQGSSSLQFNGLSLILDIVFWWLIFSVLWIVLKNYIFET